jgi:hypothetical protein
MMTNVACVRNTFPRAANSPDEIEPLFHRNAPQYAERITVERPA